MKTALIAFHKNITRYPIEWIENYKDSIINQTDKNFDIFELNYGGSNDRIFENSFFESIELLDHAMAHNYLLELLLHEKNYDLVLNSNVDDIYPLNRVAIQKMNYDPNIPIISGNYQGFSHSEKLGITKFHTLNIDKEFERGHNIIAHPACAYTKKILEYNEKLISNEIPVDDFMMWKRIRAKGGNFKILPEILMEYRISELKTKYNGK